MRRLMIADDSAVICKVAKRILTGLDYLVIEASNAGEAMIMCDASFPRCCCVDAGMTGALDLISSVRQMEGGKDVRIHYLMIEKEFKQMMAGKRAGADGFPAQAVRSPHPHRGLRALRSGRLRSGRLFRGQGKSILSDPNWWDQFGRQKSPPDRRVF
jgi:two-component system chemotaxis response regulator CheY